MCKTRHEDIDSARITRALNESSCHRYRVYSSHPQQTQSGDNSNRVVLGSNLGGENAGLAITMVYRTLRSALLRVIGVRPHNTNT